MAQRYRFFEEFRDDGYRASSGNIIAVDVSGGSFVQEGGVCYKAVCSDTEHYAPNSPVAMVLFRAEYLGERCRPVDEQRARHVHPALIDYLERLA